MGFCCINSVLPFFQGWHEAVCVNREHTSAGGEGDPIKNIFFKIAKKIKISFQEGMNLGSQPNLNNDGAFEVRNTRG